MDAILDSTVIIHIARRIQTAIEWLNNEQILGITSITWMEFIEGTMNKRNYNHSKDIMSQFEIVTLTHTDQL